jgi:hypothetical protein
MIFSILTGLGSLVLVASIVTAIQVLRAPEGFEDAAGFHIGTLAGRRLKPVASAHPRRLRTSRATTA